MRRLIAPAALALALTAAAPAGASTYTDVLHVYQQTGAIPPCRFTSPQLSSALKAIDTYGQQYFADFSNAIQDALSARAAGACVPKSSRPGLSAGGTRVSSPPLPSSVTPPTDAGLPAPIILMTAVIVIVALVLAVRAIVVAAGWDPRWALRWRHAWGQAGYRVSAGWSDFADWLRSRR